MTGVKRCDICGTIDHGLDWYRLTGGAISKPYPERAVVLLGAQKDLCSVECVGRWALSGGAARPKDAS